MTSWLEGSFNTPYGPDLRSRLASTLTAKARDRSRHQTLISQPVRMVPARYEQLFCLVFLVFPDVAQAKRPAAYDMAPRSTDTIYLVTGEQAEICIKAANRI